MHRGKKEAPKPFAGKTKGLGALSSVYIYACIRLRQMIADWKSPQRLGMGRPAYISASPA